jgi:hypothetical protein
MDFQLNNFFSISCTILIIFFSNPLLAASDNRYALIPGSNLPIDVFGKDLITLTLQTESQDEFFTPTVSPVREWNHFKCSHLQTLIVENQFDPQTQIAHQTWEIQFIWSAGEELSGCNVDIAFPNMPLSRANLYMDQGL